MDIEFLVLMWDFYRMDFMGSGVDSFKVRISVVDVCFNYVGFFIYFLFINNIFCYRYGMIFSFLSLVVIKKKDIYFYIYRLLFIWIFYIYIEYIYLIFMYKVFVFV